MLSKPAKIIISFVLGQVTQIVIHAMALNFNMWNNRQIPFCLAAGFVVVFAVIAGVWIAKPTEDEPKHEKKTYEDYAKIPVQENKVVNPLAKKSQ